jgi:hypothetical protein
LLGDDESWGDDVEKNGELMSDPEDSPGVNNSGGLEANGEDTLRGIVRDFRGDIEGGGKKESCDIGTCCMVGLLGSGAGESLALDLDASSVVEDA